MHIQEENTRQHVIVNSGLTTTSESSLTSGTNVLLVVFLASPLLIILNGAKEKN